MTCLFTFYFFPGKRPLANSINYNRDDSSEDESSDGEDGEEGPSNIDPVEDEVSNSKTARQRRQSTVRAEMVVAIGLAE